jgi:hypothetical protein
MRAWALCAALALAATASPASATDWFLTARSSNGTSVSFVDKDSIADSGHGLRRAQVYIVLRQAMSDGTASLDGLMEFDCRTPRRRYVRITGFDERLARLRTEEGRMTWTPIVEDSVDESVRQFVCSGGTAPDYAISVGSAYPFADGRARMAEGDGK